MGFSTIFKYLGLAMEAANQAAEVNAKVQAVKASDSDGGSEITPTEMNNLIESLSSNFSEVVTRICQEVDLPVKSVSVKIDMEDI